MHQSNLISIGNSTGFIMPKEVLVQLNCSKGDVMYLTKSHDGYRLTPHNPVFARQMAVAKKIMKENRDLLKELAKR